MPDITSAHPQSELWLQQIIQDKNLSVLEKWKNATFVYATTDGHQPPDYSFPPKLWSKLVQWPAGLVGLLKGAREQPLAIQNMEETLISWWQQEWQGWPLPKATPFIHGQIFHNLIQAELDTGVPLKAIKFIPDVLMGICESAGDISFQPQFLEAFYQQLLPLPLGELPYLHEVLIQNLIMVAGFAEPKGQRIMRGFWPLLVTAHPCLQHLDPMEAWVELSDEKMRHDRSNFVAANFRDLQNTVILRWAAILQKAELHGLEKQVQHAHAPGLLHKL